MAALLVCLNGSFVGYAHLQSRAIEPTLPGTNLVRVVQFNMNLFHDDPSGLAQTLLEEKADLIVLQELTPAASVIINDELKNDLPHSISLPREHAFGMAVFSRFELTEKQRWSPTGIDAAS
ncbi:MAG: endonuclease/exonuclease/phosphatase family protein, partial [Pseudomonadota bacterium]